MPKPPPDDRRPAPRRRSASLMSTLKRDRPPPLAAVVEERIREAIVYGELGLGEPISEDRIATTLGTSRTPVREALAALQLQRLVVIQPQRGSFVFRPTERDVVELAEVRAMLEVEALRLAHARDRDQTLRRMEAAEAKMEAAEAAADYRAAAEADAAFHDALFAGAGNAILVEAYALISGRVGAMRYFTRRGSAESRRETAGEHRALIAAFARADLAGAERLMKAHVGAVVGRYGEATAGDRSSAQP